MNDNNHALDDLPVRMLLSSSANEKDRQENCSASSSSTLFKKNENE